MQNGADVNCQDFRKWTPNHYATQQNNVKVAKLLIQKGADIDCQTDENVTPLHKETENRKLEAVKMFLENGADVNVQNKRIGAFEYRCLLRPNRFC